MYKSYIGITIDIIDYYPKDFDYSTCSFIFLSEENNFEREISFMNSNQICQKILITNKKEIKYSIKVLKDDYLIGISEFIIPNQIINKKEKIFDKICPINMTDSTKKILFKNSNNNITLKIGIHATLQYLEEKKNINNSNNKKENKQFYNKKKINNKKDRIKILSPISKTDNNFLGMTNSLSANKNKFNINRHNIQNKNNNTLINHHRKGDSFILEKNIKQNKIKKHKRTYSSQKQENDMAKLKLIKNKIMSKNEKKNTSSELDKETNEKNINDDDYKEKGENNDNEIIKLKNEFEKYINENSEKINEINNIDDMINFTNNNIQKILEYKLKNYDLIKEKINIINNKNKEYIKAKEKYKNNLSIKNHLIEKINDYEEQKEILLNKEKELDVKNKELFELKNNEFEDLNGILSEIKQNKNYVKKIINKNDQFLLFKVLRLISKKFGPLQNLLTQTNSLESQRIILKNIISKFNSELYN